MRLWKPITLFRVLRVPVQVHLTWLLYPAGFFLYFGYQLQLKAGLLIGLAFVLLLALSILIHELAHVIVARRYGLETRRIVLIPLGGVAQLRSMLQPPSEFWIALAGPIASLALAGFLYVASLPFNDFVTLYHYPYLRAIQVGAFLNLFLAIFNLIPCFPMDGGRMLRSMIYWLIRRCSSVDAARATLLATRITVRYIGRLLVGGLIAVVIFKFHAWPWLILFPIAQVFAELEYWVLCDEVEEQLPKTNDPVCP